jgi:hypothetical protein
MKFLNSKIFWLFLKMTTYGNPTMQQMPYVYSAVQQPRNDYQPAPQAEKPHVAIHSATIEAAYPMHDANTPVKKYYIPAALRTSCLVAFTAIILVVSTLVQVAAAASLGAPGLEFLAVSVSHEKRTVNPQSSSPPSYPPGASGAPISGDWSNPTAPAPGSWSSPAAAYFLGAYVPALVAVLISVWWKCIFARLKEMEPFYQLTKPRGVEAKESLLLSYAGSMLPMVLLKSLWSKHWLTLMGAANLVLVTLCTLFASSTLYLKGEGEGCGVIANAVGDLNNDCDIRLKMHPALGFVLGIFLFAVALLALLVMVTLQRRSSGIFAEANSIAGIASLTTAKLSQDARQSFQGPQCRYALASSSSNGTNSIVELPSVTPQTSIWPSFSGQVAIQKPKRDSHREMKPLSLVLFFLFEIAILVLIIYYGFVSKPGTGDILEDFMDSESVGIRVFMASLGLGTKFYWGWIEKYIHHTSPYIALASPQGATAEQSILLQNHSHPLIALFRSGTWRYWLTGVVTLMASLSEVLVITLTAVPFSTATAYQAHEISVYLSVAILGIMIFTVPAVLIWQIRNKKREIPEMPECIADILALVANGHGWNTLGMLDDKERRRVVKGWGTKFGIQRVYDRWQIVLIPNHPRNSSV